MPTNTQVQTNVKTTWDSATGASYSTLTLIPGLPHKDQLEIERPFTTPQGTLLRQEDLRNLFLIPQTNFTVDETTKKIVSFTTPAAYTTTYGVVVTIPAISNGNSLIIRRKSISSESLVSWVDGSRLTASQLNLQSKQLLYLTQEILDRLKYEYVTSSDVDYNATYNSATRTWVLDTIGIDNLTTVKGYIDTQDSSLSALITTLNNKVGVNLTINGASNTNVITKLNYLEGLLGGQLFTGFPQSSIVIVGNNGVKDYSSNFTLTKGSPDVLALTGNQNLTGKLTVQGTSTNDIVSIKNSSGSEVNKIDQYGNISRPVAPTTQPTNPLAGSLWFDGVNNNTLMIYNGTSWNAQGQYSQSLNYVTLNTAENITGSKSFSANTGFGISSNPLTIVDITGPASVTSFNGTTRLGTTIRGSTSTTDYSGIDFTGGTSGSTPKARIAALFEADGSKLQLGTSNTYTNGITNSAITINKDGKVGINQGSPYYSLDVGGTSRLGGYTLISGNLDLYGVAALNGSISLSGSNYQNHPFKMHIDIHTGVYYIGDYNNTALDHNFEFLINKDFKFKSNNIVIATFTREGRLGIGTSSPNTQLHIVTNATANAITQQDGTGVLIIGLTGQGGATITHNTSGVVNQLVLNATNGIVSNADIQINSTNKIITNTIQSVSSNLQLQNNTGTNRVGIGTANPTEKLEVEGNIKTTAGNKIISDTVETGIIQSSGTIEFRQGYTSSTTPDMTINADGEVVFAKSPKIGENSLLVPESPVICQAWQSGGTGFRFNKSEYTHFNSTDTPVQYYKIGRLVHVFGVFGTAQTTGSVNVAVSISGNGADSTYGLLRGLPIPIMKTHVLCQAWACFRRDTGSGPLTTVRQRMICNAYVSTAGYLRFGGRFWRGGEATGTSWVSPSSATWMPSYTSETLLFRRESGPLGAMASGGTYDLVSTNTQTGTQMFEDPAFGDIIFNSGTSGNSTWGPNTQYIIFNFSYVAAS